MSNKTLPGTEVVLSISRFHLIVCGVYVAMEGDPCRDPAFNGSRWTGTTLKEAADLINTKRWASRAERWNEGEAP